MKSAHSSFKNKDLEKGLILYNKAIDMFDVILFFYPVGKKYTQIANQ